MKSNSLSRFLVRLFFLSCIVSISSCHGGKDIDIKVISYNIRCANANDGPNDWSVRKPASIAMIVDQRPDIFGLQEALKEQIAYLEDNLPRYRCVGVGRDDGVHAGEHMSVFFDTTRVALLDWGTYWLSETPDVPSYGWGAACKRTATWTKMKYLPENRVFYYVNTHLDHISQEARKKALN